MKQIMSEGIVVFADMLARTHLGVTIDEEFAVLDEAYHELDKLLRKTSLS